LLYKSIFEHPHVDGVELAGSNRRRSTSEFSKLESRDQRFVSRKRAMKEMHRVSRDSLSDEGEFVIRGVSGRFD